MDSHLRRGWLSHCGIYSNTAAEYSVLAAATDTDGQPLSGDRNYMIHTDNKDFPTPETMQSVYDEAMKGEER